jgi:hypothetical protein
LQDKATGEPDRHRWKPCVRITVIEAASAGTNIGKTILLTATMRVKKNQNRFGEARFEGPYLKKIILPTSPFEKEISTSKERSKITYYKQYHLH